jgi:hypothetical protein
MVSMYGRGFDSRQLHDQAENNHPRQGVFVFQIPLQACLLKVDGKQKNHAQRGGCFIFAGLKLRDGERSEYPRQ